MSFSATPRLLCAGALLFLAACSPGEDAAAPPPAQTPEELALALAAFGLSEPGRVTWDNRTEAEGVYTFTGLVVNDEDGALNAETMVFAHPRLTDEGPVFSEMTMDQGAITFEAGVANFDRLLVTDPGPELADAAAAFFQGRESTFDSDNLAGQRFGALRLTGLSVDGQGEDGGPMQFSLADLHAENSDGEKLEAFSLTDLNLNGEDADGERFSMTLNGVQAANISLASLNVDSPEAMTSTFGTGDSYENFLITGLNVDAGGVRVTMPEMAAEAEPRNDNEIVTTLSMPALTVSAAPEGGEMGSQFAMALGMLGYEQIELSMASTAIYDIAADRMVTEGDNYLRFADGFELRTDQAMSGISAYTAAYAEWMASDTAGDAAPPMDQIMAPLMIERLNIEFEDQGLLERGFAAAAMMQGQEPEMMRMQAAGMVGMLGAFTGDTVPPQLMAQAQGALMGFISDGGTLSIAIEPETPFSAAAFAGQSELLDISEAGIVVTHQEPEE